mgnify:CR=1 FL=1
MFIFNCEKAKDLMKSKSIEQQDMAAELDCSEAHVSGILNGNKQPSSDVACRISKLLGVSVDSLFEDTNEMLATRNT